MSVESFEQALSAWKAAHSLPRIKAYLPDPPPRPTVKRSRDPAAKLSPSTSAVEDPHAPPKSA